MKICINPWYIGAPETGTLVNSEDPDDAAFHQGLHCLLRLKERPGTEIHHNLEKSICDPLKFVLF